MSSQAHHVHRYIGRADRGTGVASGMKYGHRRLRRDAVDGASDIPVEHDVAHDQDSERLETSLDTGQFAQHVYHSDSPPGYRLATGSHSLRRSNVDRTPCSNEVNEP